AAVVAARRFKFLRKPQHKGLHLFEDALDLRDINLMGASERGGQLSRINPVVAKYELNVPNVIWVVAHHLRQDEVKGRRSEKSQESVSRGSNRHSLLKPVGREYYLLISEQMRQVQA